MKAFKFLSLIILTSLCSQMAASEASSSETVELGKQLFHAAINGDGDTVQSLLDKGANPNVKNEAGRTALMCAVALGHTHVVDILLANETVDVTIRDTSGKTAYNIARSGVTTPLSLYIQGMLATADWRRTYGAKQDRELPQ